MEGMAARTCCAAKGHFMMNRSELVRLVGDIDDAKLLQILTLDPNIADIEEAVFWADGEADELAKSGRALSGKSAVIFEILTADIEDEPQ